LEREDIENMVSAMVNDAVNPLRQQVSEIRARIIGIDGNGTGQKGALQRQDDKLHDLDDGQKFIIGQLHGITTRQENWSKQRFWTLVRWGIPIIITLLALMLSYLGYRAAQNKPVAQTTVSHETIPADAANQ
jgi:hypothetical protein